MHIYVDADACPVVDIIENKARKYKVSVTLLCDTKECAENQSCCRTENGCTDCNRNAKE